MMYAIFQSLAIFFTIVGIVFTLVGAIGIIRMPDCYHRLHAASKCSTLGLIGLLFGAAFHVMLWAEGLPMVIKAIITIIFAFVALPTGSHILGKAAHRARAPQWEGTIEDETT